MYVFYSDVFDLKTNKVLFECGKNGKFICITNIDFKEYKFCIEKAFEFCVGKNEYLWCLLSWFDEYAKGAGMKKGDPSYSCVTMICFLFLWCFFFFFELVTSLK